MAALAMYASGIAPGRNTCATGLNSRQNSAPAASAMMPPVIVHDQRPSVTPHTPVQDRIPVAGAQRVTAGYVARDNHAFPPSRAPCPRPSGAGGSYRVGPYYHANPGNTHPGAGPDPGDGHRPGPGPDPWRPRPAGRGRTPRPPHPRTGPPVRRGRVLPDPAAAPVRRLRVRPADVLAGHARCLGR